LDQPIKYLMAIVKKKILWYIQLYFLLAISNRYYYFTNCKIITEEVNGRINEPIKLLHENEITI